MHKVLWIFCVTIWIAGVTSVIDLDPKCVSLSDGLYRGSSSQGYMTWNISKSQCDLPEASDAKSPGSPKKLTLTRQQPTGSPDSPRCGFNVSWSLPQDGSYLLLKGFLIESYAYDNYFNTKKYCLHVQMKPSEWPQGQQSVKKYFSELFVYRCFHLEEHKKYQVTVWSLPRSHSSLPENSRTDNISAKTCRPPETPCEWKSTVIVRTSQDSPGLTASFTSPPPSWKMFNFSVSLLMLDSQQNPTFPAVDAKYLYINNQNTKQTEVHFRPKDTGTYAVLVEPDEKQDGKCMCPRQDTSLGLCKRLHAARSPPIAYIPLSTLPVTIGQTSDSPGEPRSTDFLAILTAVLLVSLVILASILLTYYFIKKRQNRRQAQREPAPPPVIPPTVLDDTVSTVNTETGRSYEEPHFDSAYESHPFVPPPSPPDGSSLASEAFYTILNRTNFLPHETKHSC